MRKKQMNVKKKVVTGIMVAMLCMAQAVPVLASTPSIDELPLYSGTKNLILVVGGGVTAIILIGCGVWCSIKAGALLAASEEEKPAKKKAFINTIIISVVAVGTPGLLTWVLAFYQ